MRIAVISPARLLHSFSITGYHLVLCHLVLNDQYQQYRQFYQKVSMSDYIILDNSAHEYGSGELVDKLILAADLINPQEIVLPDVLFNTHETISRSREAYKILRSEKPGVKLMGVPQGSSIDEVLYCLKSLLDLGVNTIGLSKDFEMFDIGYLNLVERYLTIIHTYPGVEIHLLGWPRQLQLLYETARTFGSFIRGTDSAKPLVFAHYGYKLPTDPAMPIPIYPRRPGNYFDLGPGDINPDLAQHNIQVFRAWAQGRVLDGVQSD